MATIEPLSAERNFLRQWQHVTADRIVTGLLLVTCFLWLSDRWQLFGFNERKGLAVLLNMVFIGAVALSLLLWFLASVLFRWRFQFGIRSLLILPVIVAVSAAWVSVQKTQSRREQEAVVLIRKFGGKVLWSKPIGPVWARGILGDDLFISVSSVNCDYTDVSDAVLENLREFNGLKQLMLECTQITDEGLENLTSLRQLESLSLNGTAVTDAGLERIKRLNKLQDLYLDKTNVTDEGLREIKGLAELRVLYLNETNVTDAGLRQIRGLTKLRSLSLVSTRITDDGLESLKGMAQLESLSLEGTQITDAGLRCLHSLSKLYSLELGNTKVALAVRKPTLPDAGQAYFSGLNGLRHLSLARSQINDAGLEDLSELIELRSLRLEETAVTNRGVEKLRRALPNCDITR